MAGHVSENVSKLALIDGLDGGDTIEAERIASGTSESCKFDMEVDVVGRRDNCDGDAESSARNEGVERDGFRGVVMLRVSAVVLYSAQRAQEMRENYVRKVPRRLLAPRIVHPAGAVTVP